MGGWRSGVDKGLRIGIDRSQARSTQGWCTGTDDRDASDSDCV